MRQLQDERALRVVLIVDIANCVVGIVADEIHLSFDFAPIQNFELGHTPSSRVRFVASVPSGGMNCKIYVLRQ